MNKYFILVAVAWCSQLCCGYGETETERALAIMRLAYSSPDAGDRHKVIEDALARKNPRIFELQRRIGFDSASFGSLKASADLLDSQIDALLLQKPESFANGIVATRIVWYIRGVPKDILYWRIAGVTGEMSKTAWVRKMPEHMIDICAPLPDWNEREAFPMVTIKECERLDSLFDDPMPPTILPPIARLYLKQINAAAIIEMITKSKDGLKYRWAIRSSEYSPDLDWDAFMKLWFELRDGG